MSEYESLLLVSFGGPEKREDVMPFLRNVLKGRNVPEARMEEVAQHYYMFDGVSPINEQNKRLIRAIENDFAENGIKLPVYWGNRNWHPMLQDTLEQMKSDGIKRSLAFFTSGFSCYSGCRQYRENIIEARNAIGPDAPEVDKLRVFFNHPKFIETCAVRLKQAIKETVSNWDQAVVLFTAHSIPDSMAVGCNYVKQLEEASRLVAESSGATNWKLVYQSRSGRPSQPWLEPDVCDYIEEVAEQGITEVVIMPIGFVSDHMEVIFDLDVEARETCEKVGIKLTRAGTAGTHPLFVEMIRELVLERMNKTERPALGSLGPSHDVCPENCCLRACRPEAT